MARVLNSITVVAPTGSITPVVDDTFAFTGTPGFTGSGGVQRYDFKWEVDDGGGYVTIAATGTGLITAGTNPLVNSNSASVNSITVTVEAEGSYTIRMVGAPATGGSYTVTSATRSVEVAASELGIYGTFAAASTADAFLASTAGSYGLFAVTSGEAAFLGSSIAIDGSVAADGNLSGFLAGLGIYGAIPAAGTFSAYVAAIISTTYRKNIGAVDNLDIGAVPLPYTLPSANLYGAIAVSVTSTGFVGLDIAIDGSLPAAGNLSGLLAGLGIYGAVDNVGSFAGYFIVISSTYGSIAVTSTADAFLGLDSGAYGLFASTGTFAGYVDVAATIGLYGSFDGTSSIAGFLASTVGSYGLLAAASAVNAFLASTVGSYGSFAGTGIFAGYVDISAAAELYGAIAATGTFDGFVGLSIGADGSFATTASMFAFAGLIAGTYGSVDSVGTLDGYFTAIASMYGQIPAATAFTGFASLAGSVTGQFATTTSLSGALGLTPGISGVIDASASLDGFIAGLGIYGSFADITTFNAYMDFYLPSEHIDNVVVSDAQLYSIDSANNSLYTAALSDAALFTTAVGDARG